MQTKTAKLFVNGVSQAIRLPARFRFEGSQEVYVRRNFVTGNVILSAVPARYTWDDFFAFRGRDEVPQDFMPDRALNEPLRSRDLFEEK